MWHALSVIPVRSLDHSSDMYEVGWRPGTFVRTGSYRVPLHIVLPNKVPWQIVHHELMPSSRMISAIPPAELRGTIILSVPVTADAAEVHKEMKRLRVSTAVVYSGTWIDDVHAQTYSGFLSEIPPDDASLLVADIMAYVVDTGICV